MFKIFREVADLRARVEALERLVTDEETQEREKRDAEQQRLISEGISEILGYNLDTIMQRRNMVDS